MNDLPQFDEAVWDKFFEFIQPPEETMARTELQEELQGLGIDVSRAVSKVRNALEAANARAKLQTARTERTKVAARLKQVVAPMQVSLRQRVRQLIGANIEGSIQAAYFRKLETAATDADLQSLLEDIYRLEAISGGSDKSEGPDAP